LHPVLHLAGGGVDDGDGLAGGRAAPLPVSVVFVHLAVDDLREHAGPRERHGRAFHERVGRPTCGGRGRDRDTIQLPVAASLLASATTGSEGSRGME
jgi:hypothetical protein